jgi:hypothetical protein
MILPLVVSSQHAARWVRVAQGGTEPVAPGTISPVPPRMNPPAEGASSPELD